MSASWASKSRAAAVATGGAQRLRVAALVTGLALLFALLPLIAHAATHKIRTVTPDSGGTVNRVVIGDQGVQIDGENPSEDQSRSSDVGVEVNGRHRRVRVGPNGVVVTGPQNVRVMGPVVQVDGGDDDMVRVFADAEVPAGHRIDGNVVAVFGSVTVHGTVTGSTVAVFGNVVLDSTAHIGEDAVAVGGALEAEHGSTVGGESVSLGFLPIAWGLPTLPVLLLCVAIGWLCTLFFGWLLHLLFRDRMLRVAVTASRRTGLSFVLGLVSAPLAVISFVLLLITVLGIPLALLLPIVYWLLAWAGQIAATQVLGSKLMGKSVTDRPGFGPIALGTLFIAGFFTIGTLLGSGTGVVRTGALFFELLGTLMLVGLTVIGIGAFLVSRLGSQPADLVTHPSPGAQPAGLAPPAMPVPPQTPAAS